MINLSKPFRIGVSGTGFIASGFIAAAIARGDYRISAVLTRRLPESVRGIRQELLVQSAEQLVEECDMVVECSGDVIHATNVIDKAMKAGLPVVTMNSEVQVTTCSWFKGRGMLTEAEGDQSGSLAALDEEVRSMGFRPVIYGNTKRYLNLTPTREDMEFWSRKQGISLDQVTAFTDGTKVHIEQALVANGLGGDIAGDRLVGPRTATVQEAVDILAPHAAAAGRAIADYVVTPECAGGIFIAASHDTAHQAQLEYFKMGPGPYYTIQRPYHLCYLEMGKTVMRVARENRVLLDNSYLPRISVAAFAKRDLLPGEVIVRGIGSFTIRGECVRWADNLGHLPVGLVQDVTMRRKVKAGDMLTMDDVDLPDTLALRAWLEIEGRVRASINV